MKKKLYYYILRDNYGQATWYKELYLTKKEKQEFEEENNCHLLTDYASVLYILQD